MIRIRNLMLFALMAVAVAGLTVERRGVAPPKQTVCPDGHKCGPKGESFVCFYCSISVFNQLKEANN